MTTVTQTDRQDCRLVSAVVPSLCSAGPKGSATSSQGIRGFISITAALQFTCFIIKGIKLFKNCATSLIGDIYMSYDR